MPSSLAVWPAPVGRITIRTGIEDGTGPSLLQPSLVPIPLIVFYRARDFEADSLAVCFCNQAPVLIVFIFWAVTMAAPPP